MTSLFFFDRVCRLFIEREIGVGFLNGWRGVAGGWGGHGHDGVSQWSN